MPLRSAEFARILRRTGTPPACLNYFDSSLPFQLSFVNRRSRNANRYKVNIPAQEDDFNSIRGEYVEMLKGQIAKSNNGIER